MRFNYKKLVAAGAATLSIAAVLTACSGKKSNTSVNKDTKHGIALVTDGNGVDDHSFNQAAWSGFKDYGKEHGLKQGKGGYQYFESSSAADFTPNLTQAAQAGYQTIYGVGYMLTDSVKAASKKYPKKNFVLVDSVITGRKNVASVIFKSNEASYLGGLAAAYTTKTNKVGFIGGDKAKSIAQSMYTDGADIIYQAAGNAGNGVFTEAKTRNKATTAAKKVWVIGVDVDQTNLGNYTSKDGKKANFTLTSVLKGLRFACKDIADKAYKGKFPGGKVISYGLAHDGVSVTKGNLNAKTWKAVQAARKQILAGKIKVATAPSK